MNFIETDLKGAFVIEFEKLEDERGFFSRSWDKKQFQNHGLNSNIVQCNVSHTKKRGTIRGLHYQISPYEESKLVRCTKGKVFDVIIDLRSESSSYMKWTSVELTAENCKMIYVPEGFAHGFQTLEDDAEIFYQNSEIHMLDYERGIRWNDPIFGIKWPIVEKIISPKDKSWKDFQT